MWAATLIFTESIFKIQRLPIVSTWYHGEGSQVLYYRFVQVIRDWLVGDVKGEAIWLEQVQGLIGKGMARRDLCDPKEQPPLSQLSPFAPAFVPRVDNQHLDI